MASARNKILVTTKDIKFWECLPKSTTPTPQAMPKFNSVTIANFEMVDLKKDGQPCLSDLQKLTP